MFLMALGLAYQRDVARTEKAALKAEIVEWQQAAMPAIRARGWEDEVRVDNLKPRHLTSALNPCSSVLSGDAFIIGKGCSFYHIITGKYSINPDVPIQIIRGDQ